jgi:hypothetical protein
MHQAQSRRSTILEQHREAQRRIERGAEGVVAEVE